MKLSNRPTLAGLAGDLAMGRVTSRELVEQGLQRIADPDGEGSRIFIKTHAVAARAKADLVDSARKRGENVPRYAGIPFSVKDLFDLEGEVTTAGSIALQGAPVAKADAPAIARLKAAGFIIIGRTNMTEFAYSGVGLNPHYGTPLSVYDRNTGRIPGGSSSGAALSVAEGICALGISTDTGGSCRIPAAFNGIVGYKPSANAVSREGAYPLSHSFDSIGSMANSTACCASAHAIMAGIEDVALRQVSLRGKRFAVINTYLMDGLEQAVAKDFDLALHRLSRAGAEIVELKFAALHELPTLLRNGGIVACEAYNLHRAQIATLGKSYDPRVLSRLEFGAQTSEAEFGALLKQRAGMIDAFGKLVADFAGVLCPTVPITPPAVAELASESEYRRLNSLCLRNTYVFNFLDCCSGCLPLHAEGGPPTSIMASQINGQDAALLGALANVEAMI